MVNSDRWLWSIVIAGHSGICIVPDMFDAAVEERRHQPLVGPDPTPIAVKASMWLWMPASIE